MRAFIVGLALILLLASASATAEEAAKSSEGTPAAWSLGLGSGVYGAYNLTVGAPVSYTIFTLDLNRSITHKWSTGLTGVLEIDNIGPSGDAVAVAYLAYSPTDWLGMSVYGGPLYQPAIESVTPKFRAYAVGVGASTPTPWGPVLGVWVGRNDPFGEEAATLTAALQVSYIIAEKRW